MFQDGRLTDEAGRELVPAMDLTDLSVQDGELLHAFRTQDACEYELSSVLATMDVLGRAQASADGAGE
jgi:hypothetical protein